MAKRFSVSDAGNDQPEKRAASADNFAAWIMNGTESSNPAPSANESTQTEISE